MSDYKLGDVVGEDILGDLDKLRHEYRVARECLRSVANDLDAVAESLDKFNEARKRIDLWFENPDGYFNNDVDVWDFWEQSAALNIARKYGQIDGDHHKAWVIDQMVRALTGFNYRTWVAKSCEGEDGPDTYTWGTGIAP